MPQRRIFIGLATAALSFGASVSPTVENSSGSGLVMHREMSVGLLQRAWAQEGRYFSVRVMNDSHDWYPTESMAINMAVSRAQNMATDLCNSQNGIFQRSSVGNGVCNVGCRSRRAGRDLGNNQLTEYFCEIGPCLAQCMARR